MVLSQRVLGIPQASPPIADRLMTALLGADPRVGRLPDGQWILRLRPAGSPKLEEAVFAVVDVETTGAVPKDGHRITELAVVIVNGTKMELLFDSLVNPGRPIPQAAVWNTSITDEMVRAAPIFETVAHEIEALLAGRVFVAHNVGFDWRFVSHELRRARGVGIAGPRVCTVRLARRLLPGLKYRSLDSLATYFGIEIEQRHRAGPDALATGRVLQRLVALAQDAGAATVQDLVQLMSQRKRRRHRGRRAHPETMEEL